MKHVAIARAPTRPAAVAIVLAAIAAFALFARQPAIPDVAWLIEASRRWLAGATLYRDIIEVNPPLAFYVTVALTGGVLTHAAYVAGVCASIALSCLWILRLRGPWLALASLAAMLIGGLTDFGQRDHLALIFAIPLLLGDDASRRERVALGLWGFIGLALKPYFLLMPVAGALARAAIQRSPRPLLSAEMVTLGLACAAYLAAIALFHPAYLTEIVPLANFVYWAIEAELKPLYVVLSAGCVLLAAFTVAARDKDKIPLAAAMLAALATFYLQGRGWPYHFVPAIGLAILLLLWLSKDRPWALYVAIVVGALQLTRGPSNQAQPFVFPSQLRSMAVLSADVWPAYPAGLEIHNATRYPSLWIVPGAVKIGRDATRPPADKARAALILERERATIRGDIIAGKPQMIFADARGFDFIAFLGPLPGYRYAGRRWIYDVWIRAGG